MKVKVCGMKEAANISAVGDLGIDYMGFILVESSPRYAGALDTKCPASLPPSVKKTGIFVNASFGAVMNRVRQFVLNAVQLHGKETPELCAALRSEGLQVIKTFSIAEESDFEYVNNYYAHADFFLFDTKTPLYGGSGIQFDWDILQAYSGRVPFFLSGGIGPEDAMRLLSITHPAFHGVDLNSRFETEPGIKDASMLLTFINQINKRS